MKPNVLHVVGARPNFMKAAPVLRALAEVGVRNVLVHTGQHYARGLSDVFFEDLDLPEPDVHLGVGSGSHAVQTARTMERLEPVTARETPALTVVYGDVNSTLAGALVCAKLGLPLAHVEAGLRSFDRSMPEEVNRVVTDQLSDLLLTTSPEAEANLVREGIQRERIHFVGNPMIDSLERQMRHAANSPILGALGILPRGYALATLHRPANVDDGGRLRSILEALRELSRHIPVLFVAHPRTLQSVRDHGLEALAGVCPARAGVGSMLCLDPLGYTDFLQLLSHARMVITDSGGVQEETTVLGVPCLTVRHNTERPITVELGGNRLVVEPEALRREALSLVEAAGHVPRRPPLWDGRAGRRIAAVVSGWLQGSRADCRTG